MSQDFLWNTHSYTNEYIRFADTKAAVVIAWVGALISAVFTADQRGQLCCPDHWRHGVFAWTAIVTLTGAFVLAVMVLLPQLWSADAKGFVFWNNVRAFEKGADFVDALERQSADELHRHLAEHLFVIAGIAKRKYTLVTWSIRVAFLGSIVTGLHLITA